MPERTPNTAVPAEPSDRHPLAILLIFLRLGLTSFGGPVSHLGYFRAEFVTRRHWLSEGAYAELVALCQFLPWPASRQVGMALGLPRAGHAGALAAQVGFTLPSALLMLAFALGLSGAWMALLALIALQVWKALPGPWCWPSLG